MPDWHGTTGRDDLVGGGDATQFSTTIEGVTLCSIEPFTDDEREALGAYFRMLCAAKELRHRGVKDLCARCGHERYAHSPFHDGHCIAYKPPGGDYACNCTEFVSS